MKKSIFILAGLLITSVVFGQKSTSFLSEVTSSGWERKRVITEYRYSLEEQKYYAYSNDWSISHQFSLEWDGSRLVLTDKTNTMTGHHNYRYDSRKMGAKINISESTTLDNRDLVFICTKD